MVDRLDILLNIWRALFIGMLLVACLFLLSFLFTSISTNSVQAKQTNSQANSDLSNSPNVVTSGMVRAANRLESTTGSMAHSFSSGLRSTTKTLKESGAFIARGAQTGITTAARGIGSGLMFTGRTIGKGVGVVLGIPGDAVKLVSNAPVINGLIRPSDHVEVPIIDPDSPELHAAIAALPPEKETASPEVAQNHGPQWPMHGQITTEFGVSHWPYQHTHSGLDISDQRPAGTTPIKPFRPGRVIEAIYSNQGLGNHVIVDHGNGVTSVYAHLHSISVRTGQEVALDTQLGFEGTTGVSTGTHLHFEIRVHGQAANPKQFISGHP